MTEADIVQKNLDDAVVAINNKIDETIQRLIELEKRHELLAQANLGEK